MRRRDRVNFNKIFNCSVFHLYYIPLFDHTKNFANISKTYLYLLLVSYKIFLIKKTYNTNNMFYKFNLKL